MKNSIFAIKNCQEPPASIRHQDTRLTNELNQALLQEESYGEVEILAGILHSSHISARGELIQ